MEVTENMKILITGASRGIGLASVCAFLAEGHEVYGIDILQAGIEHPQYTHYVADVSDPSTLPEISNINVLVNNAGVQNSGKDIDVNLKGTIYCTEKYGIQKNIKSIVNVSCVSAHSGADFPEYCASKGGVVAYTVNTAKRIAEFSATCNSLSFGGVTTLMNIPVLSNNELWDKIMNMTPLKKWATPEECAKWIYFISCVNKSCTGQDIIIDNGEYRNHTFVWDRG